jgi:hypothetical protein
MDERKQLKNNLTQALKEGVERLLRNPRSKKNSTHEVEVNLDRMQITLDGNRPQDVLSPEMESRLYEIMNDVVEPFGYSVEDYSGDFGKGYFSLTPHDDDVLDFEEPEPEPTPEEQTQRKFYDRYYQLRDEVRHKYGLQLAIPWSDSYTGIEKLPKPNDFQNPTLYLVADVSYNKVEERPQAQQKVAQLKAPFEKLSWRPLHDVAPKTQQYHGGHRYNDRGELEGIPGTEGTHHSQGYYREYAPISLQQLLKKLGPGPTAALGRSDELSRLESILQAAAQEVYPPNPRSKSEHATVELYPVDDYLVGRLRFRGGASQYEFSSDPEKLEALFQKMADSVSRRAWVMQKYSNAWPDGRFTLRQTGQSTTAALKQTKVGPMQYRRQANQDSAASPEEISRLESILQAAAFKVLRNPRAKIQPHVSVALDDEEHYLSGQIILGDHERPFYYFVSNQVKDPHEGMNLLWREMKSAAEAEGWTMEDMSGDWNKGFFSLAQYPQPGGDTLTFSRRRPRKANPNEFSGQNPSVPVQRYDTHPNERFNVGDAVVSLAQTEQVLTGVVKERVAEDRVLVDWGVTLKQEDVDDLVRTGDSGKDAEGKEGVKASRRLALLPQSWGGTGIPTQLGGRGTYQQQFNQDPRSYNPLNQLPVQQFLQRSGIPKQDLAILSQFYGKMRDKYHDYQDRRNQAANQAFLSGDVGALTRGQGGAGDLSFGQNILPTKGKIRYQMGNLPYPGPPMSAPAAPVPQAPQQPQIYPPSSQQGTTPFPRSRSQIPTPFPGLPMQPPGTATYRPPDWEDSWAPTPFYAQPGFPGSSGTGTAPAWGSGYNPQLSSRQLPTFNQQMMNRQRPSSRGSVASGRAPNGRAQVMNPTAAQIRRAGINNLLHHADLLEGFGRQQMADNVRAAADVAAALQSLYENPRTRRASSDETAKQAIAGTINSTLNLTRNLRRSGRPAFNYAADQIDLALAHALTYEHAR